MYPVKPVNPVRAYNVEFDLVCTEIAGSERTWSGATFPGNGVGEGGTGGTI